MEAVRKLGIVVALVGVLEPPATWAVGQARLFGRILDEKDRPVAGAKITVTRPDLRTFRLEEKSDEQGNYAISLVDATKVHVYRIEKEGFQPLELTLKIPIGSNERRDFRVISLEAARAQGAAESSPAERAVQVFNQGVEALQQGDDPTARKKFEEAVALDPNLAAGWSALATLALQDKELPRAIELAEKARSLDAKDLRALRVLVEAYDQAGQKEKSAAIRAELVAVDPKTAALEAFNEGVRHYNAGNMSEALTLFEKAVAANPDHAKSHYMLGLCLASSGRNQEARDHFERFLALAPNDPDAPTAREMLTYLK